MGNMVHQNYTYIITGKVAMIGKSYMQVAILDNRSITNVRLAIRHW